MVNHSVQEALPSTYLIAPMDSSVAQQECKKSKMQPYLDACYNPNNTNQMCDVPFKNAPANLMYCQSGTYTDTTHSINTCGINRKHRNYLDKQNYKAIRKWKQIGGGKDHLFIYFFRKNMYMYKYICIICLVYIHTYVYIFVHYIIVTQINM